MFGYKPLGTMKCQGGEWRMNGKGPQCALSFEIFVVVAASLVVLMIILLLIRAYLASKNVKMCCDCYLRWVLNWKTQF